MALAVTDATAGEAARRVPLQAKSEADAAAHARRGFLAATSDELRPPLHAAIERLQ